MKKIILFLTVCMLSSSVAFSQTNLTQAVDFTVTYTDGEEFTLFDKLAEGKHVVIDFFFTTCVPCQQNQSFYTEAYMNFGCNEGDVYFLSLENTVGDAATIAYEETYAGENAPPAASGTEGGGIEAVNAYNIGAFPTFILIAPDGSILEQDMWPLTDASTFTDYLSGHELDLNDNCIVGIEEGSATLNFNVYPNPTVDRVEISLAAFEGEVTVQLFDLLGNQVLSFMTYDKKPVIDLADLSAGNYIVKVINSEGSSSKKISVIK